MAFYSLTGYMQPTIPTVWVIDDDEDDQLFIQSAFADMQREIKVLMLNDGDQLLPALTTSAQLPRLIMLDINMTRQNGFETLKQIRNTPTVAHLPVVMLSTSSNTTDQQRSLALGANQFLTKPASYSQLVTLVKGLTEQWQLT